MKKFDILIVDDEKDLRDIFKDLTDSWGYTSELAESGNEAIRKLEQASYDIILTDIKMPDGTGEDLIDYINEKKISSKVFVISAFSEDYEISLINKGASGVFLKPIDHDVLLKTLMDVKKPKAG